VGSLAAVLTNTAPNLEVKTLPSMLGLFAARSLEKIAAVSPVLRRGPFLKRGQESVSRDFVGEAQSSKGIMLRELAHSLQQARKGAAARACLEAGCRLR